jgi:hypothetical protein
MTGQEPSFATLAKIGDNISSALSLNMESTGVRRMQAAQANCAFTKNVDAAGRLCAPHHREIVWVFFG